MLNIVVHLESVRVTFHNFFDIPLGVIRILDQTRPLLIVLEHASGSWLASAEDSYHRSTGFVSSNYIYAWLMFQVQGILFEEIVFWAPDASGSPFWTLWGSLQAASWPLASAKMPSRLIQERPRNVQERARGTTSTTSTIYIYMYIPRIGTLLYTHTWHYVPPRM